MDNYKKEMETGHEIPVIKGLQSPKKPTSFIVMGDWDRHGEFHQKAVANQMTSAAPGLNAKSRVSLYRRAAFMGPF